VEELRLTRWCVAPGLPRTAVWAAFLATFGGALSGFIDYYLVQGPGHQLEAAFPTSMDLTEFHDARGSTVVCVCSQLGGRRSR